MATSTNVPSSLGDGVDFSDQHVLITGSNGAIGNQIASDFASSGATVSGVDIENTVDASWEEEGGFISADVTKPDDVSSAIESIVDDRGEISILVNSAGINQLGSVEEISVSQWKSVLAVNLQATFLCSKYSMPSLKKTTGCIINIASIAGLHGSPKYAAYGPSKAAVINLTKQMALDYSKEKIRINAIAPGVIKAGMALEELSDPDIAKRKETITPLSRLGSPRDVANVALFLASDAASFITGSIFVTDGGASI